MHAALVPLFDRLIRAGDGRVRLGRPLCVGDATAWPLKVDGRPLQIVWLENQPGRVFTRVDFGVVSPWDDARWAMLLEANHLMFRCAGPSFSADPETGHAMLQAPWPLTADAQEMIAGLARQGEWARAWLADRGAALMRREAGTLRQPPDARLRGADLSTRTRFVRLGRELCSAAAWPPAALEEWPAGQAMFRLSVDEVDIQMVHLPDEAGHVHLMADIGPAAEFGACAAHHLAATNAWLMAATPGAVICRRPVPQDCFVVRTALPMAMDLHGSELVEHVSVLAAGICLIRDDLVALQRSAAPTRH